MGRESLLQSASRLWVIPLWVLCNLLAVGSLCTETAWLTQGRGLAAGMNSRSVARGRWPGFGKSYLALANRGFAMAAVRTPLRLSNDDDVG